MHADRPLDPAALTLSERDNIATTSAPANNIAVSVEPGRWSSVNGSLNLTEYYSVTHDRSSNTIVGGAQDNFDSFQTVNFSSTTSVQFVTSSAELDDTDKDAIKPLVAILLDNSATIVEVAGHTDDQGGDVHGGRAW